MSYILEALRRSQAERERGLVPGVHAQPAPAEAAPAPQRGGLWLVGGLVLALLLALAALWWRPAAAPAVVPAVATAPAAVAVPAPVPAPASLPVVVSAPTPVLPAAAPTPVPAPAPVLAAAPSAPAARILSFSQLTAEQRSALPAMSLGGSVWSDNAATRFVIVNGQLVHEGETAAPGVVVERINPKAVVLRWRELRFELAL